MSSHFSPKDMRSNTYQPLSSMMDGLWLGAVGAVCSGTSAGS